MNKVIAQIEADQQANLRRLNDFLRIASISTDPERKSDIRLGAEWVHALLRDGGIKSEIVQTPGHPCVLGEAGPTDGSAPTVLIYGHYDVQPTGDESLWDSPAFEPTIRNGSIFARGAADDKGQVLTHLLAALSWLKATGELPIRVKFLIEGEEEVGSPNLEGVVRDHRDRLACDYVVLSDTPQFDETTPAITYGTKGMIYKEIFLTGPNRDLHSGSYGGTLTNPGNALAMIIASLRDADNRVTIPGFYDDVSDLTADERSRIGSLPFDEDAYRTGIGVSTLEGETGYTTLERRWARPTLDVNGMIGGFTGEGASTIIPTRVSCKVSMRVVPDQDADRISAAFDAAVRAAAPPGVRLEIKTHACCGAYVSPLDSPGMRAAADAVEAGFGKAPVFIREGGTLPILPLFKEVLGAESLMLGFCLPDCRAHGPNEFFRVADFLAGMKTSAHFLHRLAGCS
ncbi:MAG: dipeptidase [Planctomycetes bacterium]|nr:dipeptidase [Planctomycetota bacterium]